MNEVTAADWMADVVGVFMSSEGPRKEDGR